MKRTVLVLISLIALSIYTMGQTGPTGKTGPTGSTGVTGPTGATGLGYYGLTSTTSIAIGTGSKVFTTNLASTATSFAVGTRVRVAYTTTPTNFMEGVITAFSSTSLTVNVDYIGGSGTYAVWNIVNAGVVGTTGVTGATGAGTTGATGAAGLGFNGLTSATSLAIGTGSKVFTTNLASTATAFAVGTRVRVVYTTIPTNFMEGVITAFSSTSLTVNVDYIGGSGTYAAWNITSAGAVGSTGATGGAANVSGTINNISKFTSTTALGNSQIFDNGTNIGIGTTIPAKKLDISGDINFTGALYANGIAGATGQILTSNGTSTPTWQNASTALNSTAWLITGNTGTVDGTNFLGTTDDIPFNIRVNNQPAGRIDDAGQNVFFGYQAGITGGLSSVAIGYQALYTGVGIYNVAVGDQALYSCTPLPHNRGDYNVGVGSQSLYSNTSGGGNTAIGHQALFNNTSNGSNTGFGYQSLYNNISGGGNTAIGSNSGSSLTAGNNNVFLGSGTASSKSDAQNSMALGYLTTITADNQFMYGNSSVAYHIFQAGNVGIQTTNPISQLQVGNGLPKTSIGDLNGSAYTGYIGFNLSRIPNGTGTWITENNGTDNGGSAIFGSPNGALFFTKINSTGASNQTGLTDVNIYNHTSMIIDYTGNVGIANLYPYAKLDIYANRGDAGMAAIIVRDVKPTAMPTDNSNVNFLVYSNGYVYARDIHVQLGTFPDYVFKKEYKLMPLSEVESYIKENSHLPEVPSAAEVKEKGLDLGDMDATLLKKVEEQTLYIIDLQKQINEMQKQNVEMLKEMELLKKK